MYILDYINNKLTIGTTMTKFKTLINFKDGTSMYSRDHKEAFENAKLKGLIKNPLKSYY